MKNQAVSSPDNIAKILIINLAFIGDVILSTPVARALREHYPQACINMLTVPVAAPIAELNPYINKVIQYDKNSRQRKWLSALELIRELKTHRYDLVICTNFAVRGAIIAWAVGAPNRIGYDTQHGKWFLTRTASAERPVIRHEAENYLDVLQPLGITTFDTSLALTIREKDRQNVKQVLKRTPGRPLIIICPAGNYPRKSWTNEGYLTVIKELAPIADLALIGGKAEQPMLNELNSQTGDQAQVFGGTLNLKELTALVADADLLITVDTGPLHISQAVGTPVVALFGPTDPAAWGPRNKQDVVFYSRTDCSPCWGRVLECDHKCMESIPALHVIQAVKKMLYNKIG